MTEHTQQHQIQPPTERQLRSLMGNLNQTRVSSRKQGNRTLSYLEAWDVKRALISMFGFGGWSAIASEARVINTESGKGTGGTGIRITVMVRMTLTIHQFGAEYAEYAAASQTGQDPGEVLDFAIKTAESDALKRCAISLGTQFGLSLYDDGSMNDVVRTVLAPDQGWANNAPYRPDPAETPGPDGAEPAGAEVVQRVLGGQAAQMYPNPAPGVSDEQHAQNLALTERAFNMNAARQQEQQEQQDEDTGPAILGPDADTPTTTEAQTP